MLRVVSVLVVAGVVAWAQDRACDSAVVIGGDELCRLNFATAAFDGCGTIDWSTTGRNGSVVATNGLALEPGTEAMFAILSVRITATERDLAKLTPSADYSSITIEYVGNTGLVFSAIGFHCTGALLGITGNQGSCTNCLYLIDTEDASTTLVAQLDSSNMGNSLFYDFDTHTFYRMYGHTSQTGGLVLDAIDMQDTLDDFPTSVGNLSTVTVTRVKPLTDATPIYQNGIQAASFIGDDRAIVVNKNDTVHVLDVGAGTTTVLLGDDLRNLNGDGLSNNPKGIYCLDEHIYTDYVAGDCTTDSPTPATTAMPGAAVGLATGAAAVMAVAAAVAL